ncbi:MAG: hypothetical protein ACYDBQ_11505 [Thermoplasmatota archaeon]
MAGMMTNELEIEDMALMGPQALWSYRAPKGACDWCARCGFLGSCADCRHSGY